MKLDINEIRISIKLAHMDNIPISHVNDIYESFYKTVYHFYYSVNKNRIKYFGG